MAIDINKILDEARALGCSDLHFTVGIPPIVRQGGNLRKLSSYPDMTEIEILKICEDMCTDKQRQSIKDHIDTDFTYVSSRGFRHRVNVYRQRGNTAIALRLLRNDIPTLTDLKKILGSLGETTTVIIYATGVDLFKNKKYLTDKNKRFADFCEKHGTVCNFEYKRASDLGKSISTYLAKSGCTITKSNAEYLANLCLCDTAFISKELEKLSAYAEGREVTREDIDLLCIRRIESDGYSLAINILRGNAAMVFTRLRELDVQNYEPYAIIGIIGFSLADIYRAKLARSSGRSVADVAKDFSYAKNREFAVKNAYSECGNISAERIRKTLEILSETDLMLKTRSRGKDGDMLTLEQGLARSMALRC